MTRKNFQRAVALVPAADRSAADAVARAAGVSCKALAPVAGTPMIMRVLDALQSCERVDSCLLCGPSQAAVAACPPLQRHIQQYDVAWLPPEENLGDSVRAGLEKIGAAPLILITTADHALLDGAMLDRFLERAAAAAAAVCVGVARHDLVQAEFPRSRRTVLRFADGDYCGCNLYAIAGVRSRDVVSAWSRVEKHRKNPLRMARELLGAVALARYSCGRLSRAQACRALLKKTGVMADFIELPYPRAALDVDTPADLQLAEQLLSAK